MARPRVFVSSTYYDLKHLRSSIENFIESLGFEAVLSEKGNISYSSESALDQSCYREVGNADIFVLIIGGRYGSEASNTNRGTLPKLFYDQYNSITREEYRSAVERDVPIYVLIERAVHAEFETYMRNKANTTMNYAHVDSVNVFVLIEDILGQTRNNPVHDFDRYSDIETWLREQWAGRFQELLRRVTGQTQIASLHKQVDQLSELNTTLKRYLEAIVAHIVPDDSKQLISAETKRIKDATIERALRMSPLARFVTRVLNPSPEKIRQAVESTSSLREFLSAFQSDDGEQLKRVSRLLNSPTKETASRDLNDLREVFDLSPLPLEADNNGDTFDTAPSIGTSI